MRSPMKFRQWAEGTGINIMGKRDLRNTKSKAEHVRNRMTVDVTKMLMPQMRVLLLGKMMNQQPIRIKRDRKARL